MKREELLLSQWVWLVATLALLYTVMPIMSFVTAEADTPFGRLEREIKGLKFEIATSKHRYFLHQPVLVVFRATNVSDDKKALDLEFPLLYIRYEEGEWEKKKEFAVIRPHLVIAPPAVPVAPGRTREFATWNYSYVFNKPGKYEISLEAAGNGAVTIVIEEPPHGEEKWSKLFSEALSFFCDDRRKAIVEGAVRNCRTIFEEAPKSIYRPYAALALARYELGCLRNERGLFVKSEKEEVDVAAVERYILCVIESGNEGPLHEEALALRVCLLTRFIHEKPQNRKKNWGSVLFFRRYPSIFDN